MIKFLKFLSALGLVTTGAASVASLQVSNQPVQAMPVANTTTFSLGTFQLGKRDLQEDLTSKNLGAFVRMPSVKEILTRLQKLNPDVVIDQLELVGTTETDVILQVISDSQIYNQGMVVLQYEIIADDDLVLIESVITNIDLGLFKTLPGENDLLFRVKDLNPDLDLSQVVIKEILPESNLAILAVVQNSTVYRQGEMVLIFDLVAMDLPWLTEDLRQTDLGTFSETPTDLVLLARIKELNPNVDLTQIVVLKIDNEQAVITVIPGSTVYQQGDLTLIYEVESQSSDLTNVIRNTDLGEFEHQPSDAEILARTKELNPDLDLSQVIITTSTDGSATIKVIPGSTVYQPGSVDVMFTVNEATRQQSLREVLVELNLGSFPAQPTDEQAIARIGQLNPNVDLSQILITGVWRSAVTIAVIPGSTIYFADALALSFTIQATPPTLPELGSVLVETDLGQFTHFPSDQEALDRLQSLNPNLDLTQVVISRNEQDNQIELKVIPNSTIYAQGTITLTYRVVNTNPKTDFRDVVTTTNLGMFDQQPTLQEALDRFKLRNPDLDITQIEVLNINRVTNQISVGVIANSTVYLPATMVLNYQVKTNPNPGPKVDLATVITVRKIGEFNFRPTNQEILNRTKLYNPNLDLSQVHVQQTFEGQALIAVNANSTKYNPGQIRVDFGWKTQPKQDLTEILNVTFLGNIQTSEVHPQSILNRVVQANPNVDATQIRVLTYGFVHQSRQVRVSVGPIANSTKYERSVQVLFNWLI